MRPDPLRWLVLIHQLPPHPAYLRVKIGRRLQRLGAIPLKNAVYILPASDSALEDFTWLLQEIRENGADATLLEATFRGGTDDDTVIVQFNRARDADYAALTLEARPLLQSLASPSATRANLQTSVGVELARVRRKLEELARIDFFQAPARDALEALLADIEGHLQPARAGGAALGSPDLRGSTWVTRAGIKVDRMASAWLIRRFIDTEARFRFLEASQAAELGELRFDMVDGEYTHEGDRCTFEVLEARFGLAIPGLRGLGQVIHDIDLKDGKFCRAETEGVAGLLTGIALAHPTDEARLERAAAVLDDLLEYFRRLELAGLPGVEGSVTA